MDPFTIGAGIATGVGSLVSAGEALFGSDEPSDWQKKNYEDQKRYQEAVRSRNEQLQYEFAKNGIRWRVEDAKAAGINPIVALGGGGTSFSPISVGSTAPPDAPRSSGVGEALQGMGQNVSRAVQATQTLNDRFTTQMQELQLENQKLQNTLLGQRIVQGQTANNPP